jgi:hypothetical protein
MKMHHKLALISIASIQIGCSPRNLEDCLAEASKAPTEQGVSVAVGACHLKFNEASSPIPIEAVKEEKVVTTTREMCYVYWDGVRWQKGKTKGKEFRRFSRDFYGVDVVELSIPSKMAEGYNISNKVGEKIEHPAFKYFLDQYWYQVESLCNFK